MLLKTIRSAFSFIPQQIRLNGELRSLGWRVGGNTMWLLLARMGTQGLMLLFTLVIAGRLGDSGLGAYAFITAVVFVGNIITTFGTDMLIVREVAANRATGLFPSTLLLQLILSSIFIGVVVLVAPGLPNQSRDAVLGLQLYSLALIPMAFYTVFSAALRGSERMDSYMWLNIALAITMLGLVLLFIQPGSSILTLASLMLGAQIAAALLAAYLFWTKVPATSRGVWRTGVPLSALTYAAAPIAFLGLLKVFNQKLSVFMLSTMEGADVTGWFTAALRPVEALQVGHIALLGALFPVMAQAQANRRLGTENEKRLFSISWWLLLSLGGFVAIVLFLLAPPLVRTLYGPAFLPAIPALRLLAWTLIPFSVNIYLSSELLSSGEERKVAFAFLVSLFVLVGLNALWIPMFGLIGSCLAVLIAETVQAAIFIYLSKLRRVDQ